LTNKKFVHANLSFAGLSLARKQVLAKFGSTQLLRLASGKYARGSIAWRRSTPSVTSPIEAERDTALLMAESLPGTSRVTLGADKGYDVHEFVSELRHMAITPHIAQNDTNRRSAVDGRTTRHAGYELSQRHASASKKYSAG
jgi:hypothetical protein